MPAVPFTQLPDDARLWIFGASRQLTSAESVRLGELLDGFLAGWAAHGAPVVGGAVVQDGRFVLVGADERATGVSGCSTDTLFHALAAAERELGVSLRDSSLVYWRGVDGEIRSEPRPDFRTRAASGEVTPETTVFDNTVGTLGEMRAGRWETRMADTWHGRAFPVGATAR